ncbi:MAG: ThiF family adenylyltransferase [Planctomycetota bacterium]|jgi:molybdopterin/thiamine biosynthesis adenylyltransferase
MRRGKTGSRSSPPPPGSPGGGDGLTARGCAFRRIELNGNLSRRRLRRAARHLRLPDFLHRDASVDPSAALGRLRLAVIGCGAVGLHFGKAAARLAPAEMWLVDHGRYKLESVNTQSIDPDQVGEPKATSAGQVIKAIHPTIEVYAADGPVEDLPDDAFGDCDLVFLATDNLRAELDTSRRCVQHRRPLLRGAVFGDALLADVQFLLNRDGRGPCVACGFGAAEWEHVSRETHWPCDGVIAGKRAAVETAPTMSVAGLSSLAADLAMMLLLRHVLKLGAPLEDCLMQYCGYTNGIVTSPQSRNPDCPAEHMAWERKASCRPLGAATLRELAGVAGLDVEASGGALSFAIDQFAFTRRALCKCPEPRRLQRFVFAHGSSARCDSCGEQLSADPFATYRRAPLHVLAPVLDRSLEELGAGRARFAVVRDAGRAVFVTGRKP